MMFARLLAFVLLLPLSVHAQELPSALDDVPLPVGLDGYDPLVPTPEDVLGFRIGERHTRPHEIVAYVEAVAAASPRVTVREHARTYEGRPLVHAIVTAPEHHARLDALQAQNARLSNAPETVSDAELAEMPVIVYMGYGVHGDEASGPEAALLALYHLAAGQGDAVEGLLEETVVLLDPLFNPDGRDRFVDWVNGHRGAVAVSDPQDVEHRQPWARGRTNHYFFDLNRDWLPAEHPESRGRLQVFHTWRPQVLTDFHEMGKNATFFFQPGIPSRTNPNTPPQNQALTGRIADYHAETLDRAGRLYYTRESFDDYYYGKGSTYPDANGAVGILFEQASSRALVNETDFGRLTYGETLLNPFLTSLSTLAAARDLREDLLRYQRDYYAQADETARAADVRAYVVSLADRPTRAAELAALLKRHRIRVYPLADAVEQGGRRYEPGEAYVVPLAQQQALLAKALMEQVRTFPDSLFYDVSTWTLPLAYGVTYAELEEADGVVGEEMDPVALSRGEVVGGQAAYAYVLPWDRAYAPRALGRFLKESLRASLIAEPFEVEAGGQRRRFEQGAVIVPVRQAGADVARVHALAREAADEDGVVLYAVATGMTPDGPDLGSRGATVIDLPSVGLVAGEGTNPYEVGELWHLLSERHRLPVSLLEAQDLSRFDLGRYDVLLLPGVQLDEEDDTALADWTRGGGTLVAVGRGATWPLAQGLVELEAHDDVDLDSLLADRPHDELASGRGAQYLGGVALRARFDTTHPLAMGLRNEEALFRRGTAFYAPSERAGATVAHYDAEEPIWSGYASQEREEQARGAAAVVVKRVGGGRVVLMFDRPAFRAFWHGSSGLVTNAVLFHEAL